MAVSEESGPLRGNLPPQRLGERVGVYADENVPAGLDGLHPLGLLAERDAGNAPEIRLPLHPAGIGRDRPRAPLEPEHAAVGDRLAHPDLCWEVEPPGADAGRRPRVYRENHRPRRTAQTFENGAEAVRIARV